jgi:hypothetical protein
VFNKPQVAQNTTLDSFAMMKHDSPVALEIQEAVMLFLVANKLPFNVVDSPSWSHLLHKLNPRFSCPRAEHFSHTMLPLTALNLSGQVCDVFWFS